VAHTQVEAQLKARNIPYTHVAPPASGALPPGVAAHLRAGLAPVVPALCVQAADILGGAPVAPNVRLVPLHWWTERGASAQVVTSVKLRHVQPPMGGTAGAGAVVGPGSTLGEDAAPAVVSFLSENADTCVDEFLEEWGKVSKMVVISREGGSRVPPRREGVLTTLPVAHMASTNNWPDVRLLSFDLQTLKFAYAGDYTLTLASAGPLAPGSTGDGGYDLRFGPEGNPHAGCARFVRALLARGALAPLVALLRATLPAARALAELGGGPAQPLVKGAGWFRLLYGDLRCVRLGTPVCCPAILMMIAGDQARARLPPALARAPRDRRRRARAHRRRRAHARAAADPGLRGRGRGRGARARGQRRARRRPPRGRRVPHSRGGRGGSRAARTGSSVPAVVMWRARVSLLLSPPVYCEPRPFYCCCFLCIVHVHREILYAYCPRDVLLPLTTGPERNNAHAPTRTLCPTQTLAPCAHPSACRPAITEWVAAQ
jgi:hypothetical protein